MAKLIAGIGTSHVPSMGVAYDRKKGGDPEWKRVFDSYIPAKAWLEEIKPDVAIVIYNDHGTSFFFDQYPTFAMGVADSYASADEGFGPRPLPPVPGDKDFSWHIARSLITDEFDMTICQEMALDHGLLSPLPLLWRHEPDWPIKIIPIQVNVLQHPLPTAARCYKLGQALRRAVESFDQDLRVVIVGTGGLSHQLHGERFGYTSDAWDNEFLDLLESKPEQLTAMDLNEYMAKGGAESVEMIMWLVMRGALSQRVERIHRHHYTPMLTGFGLVVFEDTLTPATAGAHTAAFAK